jgi:hypothetical protein
MPPLLFEVAVAVELEFVRAPACDAFGLALRFRLSLARSGIPSEEAAFAEMIANRMNVVLNFMMILASRKPAT